MTSYLLPSLGIALWTSLARIATWIWILAVLWVNLLSFFRTLKAAMLLSYLCLPTCSNKPLPSLVPSFSMPWPEPFLALKQVCKTTNDVTRFLRFFYKQSKQVCKTTTTLTKWAGMRLGTISDRRHASSLNLDAGVMLNTFCLMERGQIFVTSYV